MVSVVWSAGSRRYHTHTLPQDSNRDERWVPTPANAGHAASSGSKKAPLSQKLTFTSGDIVPTWKGFLYTTVDALIVLEACLQERLAYTVRRPRSEKRSILIDSGSVFVYKENETGIKRWTDGGVWSPSRILGNFFVYRELSEPFPRGALRKAQKRSHNAAFNSVTTHSSPCQRKLVGCLSDSYGYKPGGLIKKTIGVKYEGVKYHVVSYFKLEDVKQGLFNRPHLDPIFSGLWPRQGVLSNRFKADPFDPIDDAIPMTYLQDVSHTTLPAADAHEAWTQPSRPFRHPAVLTSSPVADLSTPFSPLHNDINNGGQALDVDSQATALVTDAVTRSSHSTCLKRQASIISVNSIAESNNFNIQTSPFAVSQTYDACLDMLTTYYSPPARPHHLTTGYV